MQLTLVLAVTVISLVLSVKQDYNDWRRLGEESSRQSKLRRLSGQSLLAGKDSGYSRCKCGKKNRVRQGRIINGTETIPHKYPWMVFIFLSETNRCGGSILTKFHILTAAHCTRGAMLHEIIISVGVHNFTNSQEASAQHHLLSDIIRHENFGGAPSIFDISILITVSEIIFNPYVRPVCLPSRSYDLREEQLKIMGWGLTRHTGDGRVLREVDLEYVPFEECERHWLQLVRDMKQLCISAGTKNGCKGDSGGGVFYHKSERDIYIQVGILSYAAADWVSKPTVCSDVYAFMDWINNTIRESHKGVTVCLVE